MPPMEQIDFSNWKRATGDLAWGVQRVLRDTLILVSQEKVTLVYGADYAEGKPCLINAVGQMTVTGGGAGIPISNYAAVVSAFDAINAAFRRNGINKDHTVSGVAADALLANFGEMKEQPEMGPIEVTPMVSYEPERSDEEFAIGMAMLVDSEGAPVYAESVEV